MTFQKDPYTDAHKDSAHEASNRVSILISPWVNLRSINSQCILIVSMPNSSSKKSICRMDHGRFTRFMRTEDVQDAIIMRAPKCWGPKSLACSA